MKILDNLENYAVDFDPQKNRDDPLKYKSFEEIELERYSTEWLEENNYDLSDEVKRKELTYLMLEDNLSYETIESVLGEHFLKRSVASMKGQVTKRRNLEDEQKRAEERRRERAEERAQVRLERIQRSAEEEQRRIEVRTSGLDIRDENHQSEYRQEQLYNGVIVEMRVVYELDSSLDYTRILNQILENLNIEMEGDYSDYFGERTRNSEPTSQRSDTSLADLLAHTDDELQSTPPRYERKIEKLKTHIDYLSNPFKRRFLRAHRIKRKIKKLEKLDYEWKSDITLLAGLSGLPWESRDELETMWGVQFGRLHYDLVNGREDICVAGFDADGNGNDVHEDDDWEDDDEDDDWDEDDDEDDDWIWRRRARIDAGSSGNTQGARGYWNSSNLSELFGGGNP